MEVKYQAMDQLLTTGGIGQAPAGQSSAGQAKGADSDDFGSMVRQKQQEARTGRTGSDKKPEPSSAGEKAEAPAEEQTVSDEQYVMAAALMYQAQPDARYLEIQPTAVEAPVPEVQQPNAAPLLTMEQAQSQEEPAMDVLLPPETERAPVMTQVETALAEEQAAPVEREDIPVLSRQADRQTEEETVQAENVEREAPVFGYMEAQPVKVSGPDSPIDLQAEDGVEQLGGRIGELLVNEVSENHIEIALYPASLGKVTVELTQSADGVLHVVLGAATARAAELLERGAGNLQNLLAANNRPQVQVEVRGSEEAQRQYLNPNDENGQNRQSQQQQRQEERKRPQAQDFLQQLRLGLVDLDGVR